MTWSVPPRWRRTRVWLWSPRLWSGLALAGVLALTLAQLGSRAPAGSLSPEEIARRFAAAAVSVEVGWQLVEVPSSRPLYHVHVPNEDRYGDPLVPEAGERVPLFVETGSGSIEPLLSTDEREGVPIGGQEMGTAFLVSPQGFLLTNRHLAAAWSSPYSLRGTVGILVRDGRYARDERGRVETVSAPADWIPAESEQALGTDQSVAVGRNEFLRTIFPGASARVPARLVGTSDLHDVALIRVEVPQPLGFLELCRERRVQPGEPVVVIGYPGISPSVYGLTRSMDPLAPAREEVRRIPYPTITPGHLSRIIHSDPQGPEDPLLVGTGDVYQLTVNSAGAGNSGGPVFNSRGLVIGIFFAGKSTKTATVSFAVPIQFGLELMEGVQPRVPPGSGP